MFIVVDDLGDICSADAECSTLNCTASKCNCVLGKKEVTQDIYITDKTCVVDSGQFLTFFDYLCQPLFKQVSVSLAMLCSKPYVSMFITFHCLTLVLSHIPQAPRRKTKQY